MDFSFEKTVERKTRKSKKYFLKVRKKVRAGAASDGPKALETVEADLVSVTRMFNKEEWTMEERFTVPTPMQLNSMVVKLNSGAILLFAPARIRDEVRQSNLTSESTCFLRRNPKHVLGNQNPTQVGFGAWLEGLGSEVAWIVVPSSFHTLSLPNVLARFPEAKVTSPVTSREPTHLIMPPGGRCRPSRRQA